MPAQSAFPAHAAMPDSLNLHALDQRLLVICDALGIAAPAASGPNALARCESFLQSLKSSSLPDEACIYVVFQLFLARIPAKSEIQSYLYRFRDDSPAAFIGQFVHSKEFRSGHQAHTLFVLPAADRPLVDVTHTVSYHLNSGIQRVVRSFASELQRNNLAHDLIEFDPDIHNFRLLDDASKQYVYAWNGGCKVPRKIAHRRESKLRLRLRKLAGRRLCRALEKSAAKSSALSRRTLRLLRPSSKHAAAIIPAQAFDYAAFVWNHTLIMPELIAEPQRAERLRSVLENTPVTSSMVMFDLIPLSNPEFFLDSNGYIHHLTLLRCVDRVSCISRAVEQNVRDLMRVVDRPHSQPQIATHYLGGDFGANVLANKSIAPAASSTSAQPIVLSVGTIEIRKNHRRILRAMVAAQKQGYVFKGVFAGSPGWLSESFLDELRHYQQQGYAVELAGSVSEEQLESLYRSATFTIYASIVEGFGLPIVESVVRGVPCIASDRGCMREIANQIGGCVLVDPESEASISTAIATLLTDTQQLATLRHQASQATWRSWADYAHDLYHFSTPAVSAQASAA